MVWSDFDTDSALERDLLHRALPLMPTASNGSRRITVDQTKGSVSVAIVLGDMFAATPDKCIEMLGIRPLLVGAGWKVIDLLLETALDIANFKPAGKRWWIKEKVSHAKSRVAKPTVFSLPTWDALMATYVATEDVRHSLVHRRAYVDPANALVGHDSSGAALPPLTPGEQEALARAALRAAELVVAARSDPRVEADLVRHLAALHGVHGIALLSSEVAPFLPEIIVQVGNDPERRGRYVIDIPALKNSRSDIGDVADLIVTTADRPGQQLLGRLEDAPDARISIDFDNPPNWLS